MSVHKVSRPTRIGRQQGQEDEFGEVEVQASLYDITNPLPKTPRGIYNGIDNNEAILIGPGQTVTGVLLADKVVEDIRKVAKKADVGAENELQFKPHVAPVGDLGDDPPKAAKKAA